MRLLRNGGQYAGRAVEIDGGTPGRLAAEIRNGDPRIDCPEPTPLHGYVGCVRPETAFPLRAALAAAARVSGERAPQDDEIAALEADIATIDPDPVDLTAARERVAETGAAETELRERVARLGGKVEARRNLGEGVEAAEAELRAAATELAEAETEHLAAKQALESARERARANRSERERKRRLADRADNLRQAARAELSEALYPAFRAACERVPTPDPVAAGERPSEYDGDGTSAALAVAAVADMAAPVVLACGRFESAREAAEVLDCAVIRVQNSA